LASSIYLPRLLLHNFGCGAQRTFIYEFMNGGRDSHDNEQNYGLVRDDGTPKPAFHSIRALMTALNDDGLPNVRVDAVRRVELSIANPPADLRQQIFTLRDGRVIVALWRACRSWDAGRGEDIANPPQVVSIGIDRDIVSAAFLRAENWSGWQTIKIMQRSVYLPIDDKVTLLRLAKHDV